MIQNKARIYIRTFLAILLVSVLTFVLVKLFDDKTFPIQSVKVAGDLQHISPKLLENQLAGFVNAGFFSVNIGKIQQLVLQNPWVKSASVKRVWPSGLIISVTERTPLYRFGDDALIDTDTELFNPQSVERFGELAQLNGDKNLYREIVALYEVAHKTLQPQGLTVTALKQSPSGVRLHLNKEFTLVLGQDSLEKRLNRFLSVYQRLPAEKRKKVHSVDMRYNNGMSIAFKNNISREKSYG